MVLGFDIGCNKNIKMEKKRGEGNLFRWIGRGEC